MTDWTTGYPSGAVYPWDPRYTQYPWEIPTTSTVATQPVQTNTPAAVPMDDETVQKEQQQAAKAASSGSTQAPSGNYGQVASTPRRDYVYTPDQIRTRQSQAVGQAYLNADPEEAMKPFTQPGRSRGFGTQASAMPQIAAAEAQAHRIARELPMQDQMTNAQAAAAAQAAQGQEALQQYANLMQLQGLNDQQYLYGYSPLMQGLLGML